MPGRLEARASASAGADVPVGLGAQERRLRWGPPCLLGLKPRASASAGAAVPWGSGASLGSAVHGSDERPQHIPVLLAPDPQGTSSGDVEVVASIRGKRTLGSRTFVERGLPRCSCPVTAKAAGQAPLYEGRQSRNNSRHAREPTQERSHALNAPKDAVVRGYGASRPGMACARLSEAGRRSQPMRHTPALPRLPPKLTPPNAFAPAVAVAVAVAVAKPRTARVPLANQLCYRALRRLRHSPSPA